MALEQAAAELEDALHSATAHVVTLEQAATVSGYTADHLARLLRTGRIPNAGRRNAPRIRVGDLPSKQRSVARATSGTYDPDADARSLMSRRGGP